MSFMLSVTNRPFVLSGNMLSVTITKMLCLECRYAEFHYAECHNY
jgi:hypothetical protein